jgi:hypothetical protein
MTQAVEVRAASPGARAVFTIQLTLLTIALVGSFGLLLSAAARTGDFAAVFHPGVERLGDPKDSMTPIGPDATGNPILWIFGLSRVVAFFVRPLALAATVLGIAFLVPAGRARNRRAVRLLAIGTGAWFVAGLVALTPYGADLLGWLLD